MNDNIVTNTGEKKAVFTVKRITKILSLLCIAFVFCPSFLISCEGEAAKINVITAVKGVAAPPDLVDIGWVDSEWIAKPHIFMLVCLLIPIFVLALLYLNKLSEKQTAAIIMGSTVVDFVIWLIFRANAKKIAETYLCSFKTTGWYIINLIVMLLIIFLSTLVFLKVMRLETDLIAFFSSGGAQTAFNQMSDVANQMSSAVTQISGSVMASINDNKRSDENAIILCSKCGAEIPCGSKFCMSCGTPTSENPLAEKAEDSEKTEEEVQENKHLEEGAQENKHLEEEAVKEKKTVLDNIEQRVLKKTYDMPGNTKKAVDEFCIECGAQLRDNVKFCTKCGMRIKLRKTDIDRQNSEEVLGKNTVSQNAGKQTNEKQMNKIAIAAIAVIVIGAVAGGIVYIRIRQTNTEKAEHIAVDMQDLLAQQENEQFDEDLQKQQENEQFDSEIAKADKAEADEAPITTMETQNVPKEEPQVIQLDSRYIRSIQASSELTDSTKTYKVESVLDGNKENCWSEGVSGTGEGEFIYIEFTSPVYISEVAFLNGYMKNETVYNANGKIKRAELGFDGDTYEAEFKDFQYQEIENSLYSDRFTLDTPVQTQSLSITILEAQKGTKYEDMCLTGLAIWGYADDTDKDTSASALSAGEAATYDLYNSIIDEVSLIYGNACEYALYDLDCDGTVELITSQGTCNADWSNTVYTVDNSGMPVEVGTFYGMVSLYAAENGNGIYSVYAHMGNQAMEWITKNGNELHTETISSGDVQKYYETPIPMVGIDEDIRSI